MGGNISKQNNKNDINKNLTKLFKVIKEVNNLMHFYKSLMYLSKCPESIEKTNIFSAETIEFFEIYKGFIDEEYEINFRDIEINNYNVFSHLET